MIKAIILDVDGILIGEKIGYNSPHPHSAVVLALKKIRERGIAICLCTAKPYYSISEEIKAANLNNPHIADAGALIIDPIDDVIVAQHVLDKTLVSEVLSVLLAAGVYTEFYTVDDYFIQKDKASAITEKHAHILQRKAKLLSDLPEQSSHYAVTKIMPIAFDVFDKERVATLLKPFSDNLSFSWGVHPIALPLQFGIITSLGSSKKEAAAAVVQSLTVTFDDVLGVGDSTSDWSFIQLCGYGATLANGTKDLKKLLHSKGRGRFFLSKGSVDENGLLEVFQYFSL